MYHFGQPMIPGRTGYRFAYRAHETNHCPCCGNTQWMVGRMTAECAFCHAAVPLAGGGTTGSGLIRATKQTASVEPIAA